MVHTPFVPSGYWNPCAPLALVSTDQPLLLDICNDIDVNKLFSSGDHTIGQNILLSLIHQLSCGDLSAQLDLKVKSLPACGFQDVSEAKETLDSWRNSTARFDTAFFRDTNKLNKFKITLQEVPSPTTYTGRRNYCGGQLERDQSSANFSVSGGSGSQEASS
ncbi:unnamed protein product [Schistosoma curassoni]|uniref:SERPIN domain-containing protein n=1 Tax=Schistosoma curassoni TaxID=6186 RepID=A0A183KSF3_9TREM|nr:unnamed protein product [Schistosoma curassoni]